jgi:hypothetical protein
LPQNSSDGKGYYAVTFGDIRLIVLYVTNIWRSPSLDLEVKGRYQESIKITVFSILDTQTGKIASYRYDTSRVNEPVLKFDEFAILKSN